MNPLFTLGEEFRFHDSSRFRKKAGDAKLPFYHSFVPFLLSLAAESCRSRAESVHLLKPHLQWERVERVPTLWLQTTPQESARCARWCHWTVRFVWCPFLGLERHIEFGLLKAVLPSTTPWLQLDILISAGRSMTCGNWEVLPREDFQLGHQGSN